MSRTILKDPEQARPWPRARLRGQSSEASAGDTVTGLDLSAAVDPALGEAGTLTQRAQEEAKALIRSAQEESERLRAAARAEGRDEGLSLCEAERARLRHLAEQLGSAYESFCRKQVPELARIAVQAAEKLLGEQLAVEPERVLTTIRTAMDQVLGATHVTLRLHPDDIELVQNEFPPNPAGHGPAVRILPDSAIERGGCWIESEQGKVDATVSGRVSRLQAAMKEA